MIAAHLQLSTQCTLVTNNKKEFARVTGLKIETGSIEPESVGSTTDFCIIVLLENRLTTP